jgi:hypothetical protein
MRLSERAVSVSDLVISSEQSAVRTPGVHVSQVIRHMSKAIGRQKENDFSEADLNMFATVGRLWEAQLATAMFLPPRYERVGEIEQDGIIGSPDAIDTVDWAVQEYKVRWASATHPIESNFEYMTQIKAYCYMLSMCRASLFVFYVCGTWRPPVPIIKAWDILFAPGELQDNWAMILDNAKALR